MHEGAIADGGTVVESWQIPKFGDSMGGGSRGVGQAAGRTAIGTSQGPSSTGIGGLYASGVWPGEMAPMWHRGFFGGPGIRTGGGS